MCKMITVQFGLALMAMIFLCNAQNLKTLALLRFLKQGYDYLGKEDVDVLKRFLKTVLEESSPNPLDHEPDGSPDHAYHPAWKKLDEFECGDSASDRIIGGTNAALGQFPWIVRLGYTVPDDTEPDWMCGGALVTDRHVITAAHCALQTPDDGFVLSLIRIGEHNVNTDPDCELSVCAPPLQDRHLKTITIHPNFKGQTFHNDIAIIELDRPVDLNDYVAPICLPRAAQMDVLPEGELVTVAGWGKMNMTTEERAQILQVVSIPIVKPETCNTFGKTFKLNDSEICAGAQSNKDACGGDSGGPLMKVYDTPDGPKNYLVGVVSFGPTICGIKKPGVYTSVPHFLGWILDHLV